MSLQIDDDHVMNDIYHARRAFDDSYLIKIRICYRVVIIILYNNFHEISNNVSFKSKIKNMNRNAFALSETTYCVYIIARLQLTIIFIY